MQNMSNTYIGQKLLYLHLQFFNINYTLQKHRRRVRKLKIPKLVEIETNTITTTTRIIIIINNLFLKILQESPQTNTLRLVQ